MLVINKRRVNRHGCIIVSVAFAVAEIETGVEVVRVEGLFAPGALMLREKVVCEEGEQSLTSGLRHVETDDFSPSGLNVV